MKKYNKLIYLLLIVFIFNTPAKADTFQSFLSDAVNDIKVLSKAGTCNANPFILKQVGGGYTQAVAPCTSTVVNCPTGSTAMPQGLSQCQRIASASIDPTILALLQASNYQYSSSLGNMFGLTFVHQDLAHPKVGTGIQCNGGSDSNGYGTPMGYTPYCFLDLAKIQKVPAGSQRYFQPYNPFISGSVVTLWSQNGNTALISLNDLNNKSNYVCYPANYTANPRCITLPAGFLDTVGFH